MFLLCVIVLTSFRGDISEGSTICRVFLSWTQNLVQATELKMRDRSTLNQFKVFTLIEVVYPWNLASELVICKASNKNQILQKLSFRNLWSNTCRLLEFVKLIKINEEKEDVKGKEGTEEMRKKNKKKTTTLMVYWNFNYKNIINEKMNIFIYLVLETICKNNALVLMER